MSVSSSLDVQIAYFSQTSTLSIIKVMINAGWNLNLEGKTNYLPIGDGDNFNWQNEVIDILKLFEIISKKESQEELIGITMTWKKSKIGGDFLFFNNGLISINLSINRKKTPDNITDANWYIKKTVILLRRNGFDVESFDFSEHV